MMQVRWPEGGALTATPQSSGSEGGLAALGYARTGITELGRDCDAKERMCGKTSMRSNHSNIVTTLCFNKDSC